MFDKNGQEVGVGDLVRFQYKDTYSYITAHGIVKTMIEEWSSIEFNNKRYKVKTNTLVKV